MTTIVVFASSLFVASALVSVKAVELKHNKKNIFLEFINRLDAELESFVAETKFRALQLIQSVRYIILVQAKILIKDLLKTAEQKLIDEYQKIHDAIMGRRIINHKGSASFYLKKISENKISEGKGKIEDRLQN